MGGKALKNTVTRRYNEDEYLKAFNEVSDVLMNFCDQVALVKAYEEKDSFGDMDLVVVLSPSVTDVVKCLKEYFNPNEVVKNTNVVSFNYKDLQVDLLVQPDSETYDFAKNYFAFNDLGNFLGRTAHRLGFKFGHDGMWYVLRDPEDPSYVVAELLVTKDFDEALTFLGFSPGRFKMGFKTKEEVFDYASSSVHFDPAQFLLENRASESRRRDRKRVMYQDALAYFAEKYDLKPGTKKKETDKARFLQDALLDFHQFMQSYNEAVVAHLREKAFKKNFNGNVLGEHLGLEGKELGAVMKKLREYFTLHNLKDWVASLSVSEFLQLVDMLKDGVS